MNRTQGTGAYMAIENQLGKSAYDDALDKILKTSEISFGWRDVLFNQDYILEIWRYCNKMNLHPVADTILGRIKGIRISAN
ncbi:MAG: hypothetical protein QM642_08110 [Edaphocola sp.]